MHDVARRATWIARRATWIARRVNDALSEEDKYGMTLDQIAKQVIKDNVRIIIDITPNEYGSVTQHLEVEPWEPFKMKCPYKD